MASDDVPVTDVQSNQVLSAVVPPIREDHAMLSQTDRNSVWVNEIKPRLLWGFTILLDSCFLLLWFLVDWGVEVIHHYFFDMAPLGEPSTSILWVAKVLADSAIILTTGVFYYKDFRILWVKVKREIEAESKLEQVKKGSND